MATDIHISVEYLERKTNRYKKSPEDFGRNRHYLLFDLLGGGCGNRNPLYHTRGLPIDVSDNTYKEYKKDEEGFHHASWLTTMEFRECLDECNALEATDYDKIPEDHKQKLEYLHQNLPKIDDPMKNYELIYKYMKDSDDEGEPARIIFWFDN